MSIFSVASTAEISWSESIPVVTSVFPGTAQRIAACCRQYGLPTGDPAPLDALCQNCLGDKKRSGDHIDVVVLREIGRAETVRLTMAELKEFVEAAL